MARPGTPRRMNRSVSRSTTSTEFRFRSTRIARHSRAIVQASNDTDSTAELEIQLTGLKNLTIDDFYL
jgi:hypothetical protein